jgi:HEPN domain-containing protein
MATNGDLARRLLGAAREDELAAISVLRVEGIANPIVGFHAHQAVEKAIKAVLSAKGTEFPFTHDLERLRTFSEKSGIELPSALDEVEDLTPFARDERYGSEIPTGLDRDQALKWAAEAIAWAQGIVDQTAAEQKKPPTEPDPSQTVE